MLTNQHQDRRHTTNLMPQECHPADGDHTHVVLRAFAAKKVGLEMTTTISQLTTAEGWLRRREGIWSP